MAEETKDERNRRLMEEERAELKSVLLKEENGRVAQLIEETRTTMKLLCNYLETANELLVDCGDGEEEEFRDAKSLVERGRRVLGRLDAVG